MPTITVPINAELEEFINEEVGRGKSESKAHLVRAALLRLREERALARLNEAEEDIRAGRVYKGDLRVLLKKMKSK
jgi:Arc/MetJ-type ribon-helix-helix transcriptional regulator